MTVDAASEPPQPTPPAASPDSHGGSETAGVPCIDCRYDLTGLAADDVCPECGGSIVASVRRWQHPIIRPLERSDRSYVRRLFAGSIVLTLAWACAALTLILLFREFLGTHLYSQIESSLLATLVSLTAMISLVGLLLLTSTEPGAPEARVVRVLRHGVRLLAVCATVLISLFGLTLSPTGGFDEFPGLNSAVYMALRVSVVFAFPVAVLYIGLIIDRSQSPFAPVIYGCSIVCFVSMIRVPMNPASMLGAAVGISIFLPILLLHFAFRLAVLLRRIKQRETLSQLSA